ncbi:MAG: MFS transporter [Firmicutes bacterium]|nr:MFS transporter [Bacillota bacterium]
MNRESLTWTANLSLVLIGLIGNIIGPVMPSVIGEYGISLATAGMVFTAQGLGRIVAVFSTSSWSDRVGRKPVMRLGGILTVIGAIGYGISPIWFGNILSAVVLGAGSGMLDGASNALVSDLYTEKRGLALNRLHVFFGLGSLIGPLVAAFFLGIGNSWRLLFLVIAAMAGAHVVFSSSQSYPEVSIGKGNNQDHVTQARKTLLTSPEFWLLSGIMFTYSGMGGTIVGWVNTYLSDKLTVTVLLASVVLALYNVGLTVGRLIWGGVSERVGYPRTLLICALGGLVFVTSAVLGRQLWWIAISFWLTGFFLAGLFPTAVAHGTGLFSQLTGTVSGYMITAASLGGMILPFLVGALSDVVGLRLGMLAAPFFGIAQLVLAASLQRRQAKGEVSARIGV